MCMVLYPSFINLSSLHSKEYVNLSCENYAIYFKDMHNKVKSEFKENYKNVCQVFKQGHKESLISTQKLYVTSFEELHFLLHDVLKLPPKDDSQLCSILILNLLASKTLPKMAMRAIISSLKTQWKISQRIGIKLHGNDSSSNERALMQR